MVVLRYVGYVNELGDPTFLDGVPARDLTAEDVEERELDVEALVASRLYEHAAPPAISAERVKERIQELQKEQEVTEDGDGSEEAS